MNRFDNMSKDAMARVEEIMNSTKLNEFLHRKEEEEKKKTCILWILAIIGVVAAVAAIAYGVYRFFTRITWKTLKMISTTTSMMTSSRMRTTQREIIKINHLAEGKSGVSRRPGCAFSLFHVRFACVRQIGMNRAKTIRNHWENKLLSPTS